MKKILIISLAFISLQFTYAGTCLDITKNITRGEESSFVLSLQNFLAGKGFLKATPNGYFGPATFAAVKAYQKSVSLSQVGNVGPGTRAAIKKDTCNTATSQPNSVIQIPITPTTPVITIAPVTASTTVTPNIAKVTYKTPKISSMSNVTFFAGGAREWDVYLYGTDFSTSSPNNVYFKSRNSQRRYFIGNASSTNGTTLTLPRDLMTKAFSCGNDCSELIPVDGYTISVVTNELESNYIYTTVSGFNSSVVTGTQNQSIKSVVLDALFGRLTFAASSPFQLISVTPVITTEDFPSVDIKATRLKDESTGKTFEVTTNTISEYQSQILALYGDINGFYSGRIMTTFKITIMDYISHQNTTFTSPSLLTTVTAF